jgi:hypothetical protein
MFREGDRVKYVGPPPEEAGEPRPGEGGWVLTRDDPDAWVVTWDEGDTAVYHETYLRRVGNRNEPDPMKRLPGDSHAPADR